MFRLQFKFEPVRVPEEALMVYVTVGLFPYVGLEQATAKANAIIAIEAVMPIFFIALLIVHRRSSPTLGSLLMARQRNCIILD